MGTGGAEDGHGPALQGALGAGGSGPLVGRASSRLHRGRELAPARRPGRCPCRDREARSCSSPSRGGPGPPQPQPRAPGLAASTAERGGFQAGRTLPSRARRDVGGPVTPPQTNLLLSWACSAIVTTTCLPPPMTRPSGLTFQKALSDGETEAPAGSVNGSVSHLRVLLRHTLP